MRTLSDFGDNIAKDAGSGFLMGAGLASSVSPIINPFSPVFARLAAVGGGVIGATGNVIRGQIKRSKENAKKISSTARLHREKIRKSIQSEIDSLSRGGTSN